MQKRCGSVCLIDFLISSGLIPLVLGRGAGSGSFGVPLKGYVMGSFSPSLARLCFTYVAVICDDSRAQPYLPHFLLGNGRWMTKKTRTTCALASEFLGQDFQIGMECQNEHVVDIAGDRDQPCELCRHATYPSLGSLLCSDTEGRFCKKHSDCQLG